MDLQYLLFYSYDQNGERKDDPSCDPNGFETFYFSRSIYRETFGAGMLYRNSIFIGEVRDRDFACIPVDLIWTV